LNPPSSSESKDRAFPPTGVRLTILASVLYFAEGLPYGLVTELMPLYMRMRGASLTEIGFISAVSFAWTIKLLWAPLIDTTGTYRRWIGVSLAILCGALALMAGVDPYGTPLFWVLLVALAVASATQDIAIDAFTITVTPREQVGTINATRVTAYRVAIILAGGGLAALASRTGWNAAFGAAAVLLLGVLVLVPFMPERRGSGTSAAGLLQGLRAWVVRRDALALLGMVLLFRLGDAALAPMVKPFWVDLGYSAAEIGTVTTVLGISFTIIGALLGGLFVNRYGIFRALVVFGIIQTLSNGGYALVASLGGGRPAIYAASIVENLTGGLGVAAFLSFLMAICDKRLAATEYAMLTAIFGLSRSIAGTLSGVAADSMGYAGFFWLTVALGVPGLLLLPHVRRELQSSEL
jgi:MFS transporter, PAT family, beta-lactamase induction signal transducer AmpG